MLVHDHTGKHLKSHANTVYKMTINTAYAQMCLHAHEQTTEKLNRETKRLLPLFLSLLCPSLFSFLLPQKSGRQAGRQAAGLESRPIRVVSSNRISPGERERDDKPVCCHALSLLKYITHSVWSCWSQTAVDLITPRALCGHGTF